MRSYISLAITLMLMLVATLSCPRVCNSSAQLAGTSSDPKERIETYEASCIGNLRIINVAQGTYRGGDSKKGYARSLRELGPKGEALIVAPLASGKKDGYHFILTSVPAGAHKPISHYTISARPVNLLMKGQRSFFTDETGVIRSTTEDRAATTADPPID